MSGTIPPILPPLVGDTSNPSNRANDFTTDNINTTTTNNVAQSVIDENLPQLLESRGGSHVTNIPKFDTEDFSNWKDRFLVYLDGLEPYLLEILQNGPFGPSDTRDTKIAALRLKFNAFKALEGEKVNGTFTRLKCLLNDLENNDMSIPQAKVNATFVNSLPRKWLSMNQTQRANNSIKNDTLAALYGKYNYKEGLIDQIQLWQRALLANQKRFYKRPGRVGSVKKPLDRSNETCFSCGKHRPDLNADFKKSLLAN
ncbi:hypothetical protein Tco_1072479 [Tanacetum coccineum]